MFMPTVFHENLFDDLFDPFWNEGALERAMNREARDTFGKRGANMMKTDVKQTDNGYEVDVDLPGCKKEDVQMDLNDGYLTIGYASERADIRRLDASGTAQYVDGCGHLRSSTSSIEPTATAGPELAPRAPKPVQRDDERRRLVREAQAIDGIFVGEHGGKPRGGYAALLAHSNASRKLPERTNSFKKIMGYFDELWAQTVDPKRPVKRINLGFGNLMPEEFATIDLFSDVEADERERELARAVLAVKGKYGKNALVKGLSFTAGATARERNDQVGGHRA